MVFFYRALVLLTCAIGSLCYAQVTGQPLRLEQAIAATLEHNPQLATYQFKTRALQGESKTAELKPGYQLNTSIENLAGSGEYKNFDSAELTLSLSSVIELGRQRDARRGLVTARQQQLLSEQRIATLDLIVSVTQQFIRIVEIQEKIKLQHQVQTLGEETLSSINRQLQAGKSSEAELLRARAAVELGKIELGKMTQTLHAERSQLSSFWRSPGDKKFDENIGVLQANLYQFPPQKPVPELMALLADNPDMELLAKNITVREANLKQARSKEKPAIEWSAGIRHLQATDDSALVLDVSVPLGTKGRSSGAVTTASAELEEAKWQRSAAQIQLESHLVRLANERQQALDQANNLHTQVIPLLQQALRLTADAFNRGRYSYMELNLAQRELIDAQAALITAATQVHLLNTEIDRLTGSSIEKVLP